MFRRCRALCQFFRIRFCEHFRIKRCAKRDEVLNLFVFNLQHRVDVFELLIGCVFQISFGYSFKSASDNGICPFLQNLLINFFYQRSCLRAWCWNYRQFALFNFRRIFYQNFCVFFPKICHFFSFIKKADCFQSAQKVCYYCWNEVACVTIPRFVVLINSTSFFVYLSWGIVSSTISAAFNVVYSPEQIILNACLRFVLSSRVNPLRFKPITLMPCGTGGLPSPLQ